VCREEVLCKLKSMFLFSLIYTYSFTDFYIYYFISTCQVQSALTATHLTFYKYYFFTFSMLAFFSYMYDY